MFGYKSHGAKDKVQATMKIEGWPSLRTVSFTFQADVCPFRWLVAIFERSSVSWGDRVLKGSQSWLFFLATLESSF